METDLVMITMASKRRSLFFIEHLENSVTQAKFKNHRTKNDRLYRSKIGRIRILYIKLSLFYVSILLTGDGDF